MGLSVVRSPRNPKPAVGYLCSLPRLAAPLAERLRLSGSITPKFSTLCLTLEVKPQFLY